jgi:hypothetical protein
MPNCQRMAQLQTHAHRNVGRRKAVPAGRVHLGRVRGGVGPRQEQHTLQQHNYVLSPRSTPTVESTTSPPRALLLLSPTCCKICNEELTWQASTQHTAHSGICWRQHQAPAGHQAHLAAGPLLVVEAGRSGHGGRGGPCAPPCGPPCGRGPGPGHSQALSGGAGGPAGPQF